MPTKTDTELVMAYAETADDPAFSELVARYQTMVFRTCLRVLGSVQEAEDATQAAFIVLARKADSLRRQGKLGGWLHRVARNVALQALERRAARARRQEEMAMWQETVMATSSAPDTGAVRRQLDAELDGLSAVLREAVVLRYLRGCSEQEAAALAGCPLGTMKWRANEGLAKLRARLTRRGVAIDDLALTGLLAAEATATVPQTLHTAILTTVKSVVSPEAATAATAGSAKALTLAQGALKTLFWAKVKTAAVAVVLVAAVAAGGVVAHRALAPRPALAAVTPAAGLAKLSPADAWVRDLLARAEAGPWGALDLERGTMSFEEGGWRLDTHGERAGTRLWQSASRGGRMVLFDAPGGKWKRAVLVGRMMILPDGEMPTSLAIPKAATNGAWQMGHLKQTDGDTDFENGVYSVLYGGATTDNASIYLADGLLANRDARGVWHRYALYFDADAAVVVFAVWPEDRAAPPAVEWERRQKETLAPTFSGKEVGVGLLTQGVPALWQGLKLVPLGPDMPLPPERVGKRPGKDRRGVESVE